MALMHTLPSFMVIRHFLLKTYESAIPYFKESIQKNPDLAYPYNGLGNVSYDKKEYDEAIYWHKAAIEKDPDYAYPYNGLGNVFYARKEYDEAINWYKAAIKKDPDYAYPYYNLALVFYTKKEYDEAINWYKAAIKIVPDYADPYNGLGNVFYARNEYDEAINWYKAAIEKDPDYAYPYNGLGNVFYARKEYNEAINWYKAAIEKDPHWADPYYNNGLAVFAQQRFDEAVRAFGKAITINPNNSNAWFYQGNALANLGKQRAAIKAYEKSLSIAPHNILAQLNTGIALAQLGKVNKALIHVEEAIQIDPQNIMARFSIGVLLVGLGRYEEGLSHLSYSVENDLKQDSLKAIAWLQTGLALSKLERPQEALEAFEKTLQIDPKNASAWANKGLILSSLGRHDEAAEAFKKSAEYPSQITDINKKRGWREKLLLATQKKRTATIMKICGELIELYTRIFNLMAPAHSREPQPDQTDVEAQSEPKCDYLCWPSNTKCARSLLKGHDKCFWHVADIKKYDTKIIEEYFGGPMNLKEAIEMEVRAGNSLEGAYLRKASIGGDWNKPGAMLPGAILRRADLSESHLSCGSLKGADLTLAKMEEAYLSDVDFRNTKFWHTKLYRAKFRNNDFAGATGLSKDNFQGWKYSIIPFYRILETYPDQCEWVYRSLAKNFVENGLFDDASWAVFRGRLMHHKVLITGLSIYKIAARILFENSSWPVPSIKGKSFLFMRWGHNLIKLLISYLSRFIWGYGERPIRVGLTATLVIIGYAALFAHNRALLEGTVAKSDFISAIYFSIVTFTTLGYGDLKPAADFRLWAASEALVGGILMGLFLFTLARRASGRG